MSTGSFVNSPTVVSQSTLGYLEAQKLRNSDMSVVTPRHHKRPMGGPHGNASTKLTYPSPENSVKYLAGFGLSSRSQKEPSPRVKRNPAKAVRTVEQETTEGGAESFEDIARKVECHVHQNYRENTCEARDPKSHPAAIKARAALLEEFGKTSVSGIYPKDSTIRAPFGSSEIWPKEGAVLVAQHPYRIGA